VTWHTICTQQWRDRLRGDNEHVLVMAHHLAWALQAQGEYGAARDLDQDTWKRSRRVLGEDHPFTLAYASGLPADLHASGRGR
jgi:hypothetical protein